MSAAKTPTPGMTDLSAYASGGDTGSPGTAPAGSPDPSFQKFRQRARQVAILDRRIDRSNDERSAMYRRRDILAAELRMELLRQGVAEIAIDDPLVKSVALETEQKYRPMHAVTQDGEVRVSSRRCSRIVVRTKRQKRKATA